MRARLFRTLYFGHRWLGIVLGVLVLIWFLSGIVMMYVGYPDLTDDTRKKSLAGLQPAAVQKSAAQAVAALGMVQAPIAIRLNDVGGRPAYHLLADGHWQSVWADDGRPVGTVQPDLARVMAERVLNEPAGQVESLENDQWTFGGRMDAHRPLYRVTGDASDDYVYISSRTGEVLRIATRRQRLLNYAGSILHWVYFTPLRENRQLWRQTVMVLSALAFTLVALGSAIGLSRLRVAPAHRYSRRRFTPYRGAKKLHHILGLATSIVALTWLFSGWLSVNPFSMFPEGESFQSRQVLWRGGEFTVNELARDLRPLLGERPVAQVDWLRFDGRSELRLLPAGSGKSARTFFIEQGGFAEARITEALLLRAASRLTNGNAVAHGRMLATGDDYHYKHHEDTVLPVFRLDLGDAQETACYVNPEDAQMIECVTAADRLYRWLFNGLHRLDFRVLFAHRPVWDILLILFCSMGGVAAMAGVVMGVRRLQSSR